MICSPSNLRGDEFIWHGLISLPLKFGRERVNLGAADQALIKCLSMSFSGYNRILPRNGM
jgi:hypothetical protein